MLFADLEANGAGRPQDASAVLFNCHLKSEAEPRPMSARNPHSLCMEIFAVTNFSIA
jgi:hypothetical protein